MKSEGTNFFKFELLEEPKGFGARHADIEQELAVENRQVLKYQVWQRAKKAGLLRHEQIIR